MAYVGEHKEEQIFKYGETEDINRRIGEHKRSFPIFELILVEFCDNNKVVENKFKQHIKSMKYNRRIKFYKNSEDTELFAIDENFTYNTAKDLLMSKIQNNDLPIVKEYKTNQLLDKIKGLEDKLHLKDKIIESKDEFIQHLTKGTMTKYEKPKDMKIVYKRTNTKKGINLKHLI